MGLEDGQKVRVIFYLNKDNKPLCVMMSYSLIKNIDLEKKETEKDKILAEKIKNYYSYLSLDEKDFFESGLDDGIR